MPTPVTHDVVDLFAGPGGWDIAAHSLGLSPVGIEWDRATCNTRRAAGLATIEADVRAQGPAHFPGAKGLIASPPCQTFSIAGGGSGRRALEDVLSLIKAAEARQDVDELLAAFHDERTALVLEPLRWALEALDLSQPYQWLAFEQVPAVLPVWEAMAEVLRREGYSVATGKLSAEQYGVPQTRKRAILVARRDGQAVLPAPTHRAYRKGTSQDAGDPNLLPWVSMAEALGWGATARPSMTVTGGGTAKGGPEPFGNGARQGLHAEQDAGRWEPRVVVSNYGTGGDPAKRGQRSSTEPAAAVTSKVGRNKVRGAPGNAADTRLSTAEVSLLQSFPVDHPWQGTRSKVFEQIGNAIPPLLARAVLSAQHSRQPDLPHTR